LQAFFLAVPSSSSPSSASCSSSSDAASSSLSAAAAFLPRPPLALLAGAARFAAAPRFLLFLGVSSSSYGVQAEVRGSRVAPRRMSRCNVCATQVVLHALLCCSD
jgi:hypothetical protein